MQEAMLWLNPASLPQPFPEVITVTIEAIRGLTTKEGRVNSLPLFFTNLQLGV
jgi:hypothetical protein